MDRETAGKVIDKAMEIFNVSAVKTFGDLAKQIQLSGSNDLPEEISAHSLSPDTLPVIPNCCFLLMKQAGFENDAVKSLVEAAYDVRKNNIRQAHIAVMQLQ